MQIIQYLRIVLDTVRYSLIGAQYNYQNNDRSPSSIPNGKESVGKFKHKVLATTIFRSRRSSAQGQHSNESVVY